MRLNTPKIVSACLICVLLSALLGTSRMSATGHSGARQKSVVVFAVNGFAGAGNGSIDPLVIIEGGQYKEPLGGDAEAAQLAKFANDYYRPGQKYRVLSGGGEAGSLTIKKDTKDQECARPGAEVKLNSTIKLNRNVMALATNSDALGRGASSRRSPTTAERAGVMRLVKKTYLAQQVPAALLQNIETVNLTAMDLDHDGKFEMVGSFVAKKTKGKAERFLLFLLAEPQGNDFSAGVSNFSQYTNDDIMSGASITAIDGGGVFNERLVDQLDLNDDRTGEVITIFNGFESDTYRIYKKSGGKWSSVYEFGQYRCAF